MFGIGFPEMIVILVVALLVVGPDKLPDMARSMAKWTVEMKKTVNELKESLTEEENAIRSVSSDLHKTVTDLKGDLPDTDIRTWQAADTDGKEGGAQNGEILEMEDSQPLSPEETSDTNLMAASVSDSAMSKTPNGPDKNKVAPDDSRPAPA